MTSTKIAIVDTGIQAAHRWLEGAVVGGVGVCTTDDECTFVEEYDDITGHGTSVASVIHALCPQASLYAVRIAERAGSSINLDVKESTLAHAIKWCVKEKIGIVNISYSMEGEPRNNKLVSACELACRQGAVILGSYRSDGKSYFPAAFPWVLGVRWSKECEPGQVKIVSGKNADVATWGGPVDVAYLNNSLAHHKGASYACAAIAAMVARIREYDSSANLRKVMYYLEEIALSM